MSRDQLTEALWPHSIPATAPSALTVLLSKLRAAIGPEMLGSRRELRLDLPVDTRVDVEDALAAVHEAQSAVAQSEWRRAWLDDVLDRALEAYAASCLGIGGTELPAAERAARTLLQRSPLRETGYVLLMDALAAQGNVAHAMHIYDRARSTLDEQLGITPGRAIQHAHARLLGVPTTPG